MKSNMENLKENWPNTVQGVTEIDEALEAGIKSGIGKGSINDALTAGISKARSQQKDNG